VNDIDALFAALSKAEVTCAWDDALGGVRRFYADDPWGNRLEFTLNLVVSRSNLISIFPFSLFYFLCPQLDPTSHHP
jgi:hypothetical protein